MGWRSVLLALSLGACFPQAAAPVAMAHPRVQFVFWGTHPEAAQTQADYAKLIPGHFFGRMQEYGVGAGTMLPPVFASPSFPPVIPDGDLLAELSREVGPRTSQDIVVVILPPGSTTSLLQGASAYHGTTSTYAYCVVSNGGISHEIAEAATRQEIGDPCEGRLDTIDGVLVQQVWSVKKQACL